MQIEVKRVINVLPILIKNFSAEKTQGILDSVYKNDRDLSLVEHSSSGDDLIILVEGVVGNYLDTLIVNLSGLDKLSGEYALETLNRASKIARVLSDEEYHKLSVTSVNLANFDADLNDMFFE
ncbi:hypothetical protein KAU11_03480 [Candidatus Babeliales bacterium]|nr:hypothetical protein [Candidatus Babeliales bacterium]